MRLRNRKTGEIVEYDSVGFRKGRSNGWDDFIPNADSLAALNDVWEDYKPAEPLIKDEKIRKAVRAWAELHELENVFYFAYSIHKELSYLKSKDTGVVIDIVALPELEDGEIYTITELCGEEEE